MQNLSLVAGLLLLSSTAFAQEWTFSTKSPEEVARSGSIKTDKGEIVALWRAWGHPGDEIITYHDFTETGFRRIQYFYNGVIDGTLVIRKLMHYSYRTGYRGEPYYGPEEILYFPPARSGHYELRSEHFDRIWFRVSIGDAGRATTSAHAVAATRDSVRPRPNEELKLTALASDAAGSLRSPAALLMVRRSLTPAR